MDGETARAIEILKARDENLARKIDSKIESKLATFDVQFFARHRYQLQGVSGERGKDGAPGKRGKDGAPGEPGNDGTDGAPGDNGWSPLLAVKTAGDRRAVAVVGWTGGSGEPPSLTGYIGPDGIVEDVRQATDIRGPKGASGSRRSNTIPIGGPPGPRGKPGADGEPGVKGDPGEPGTDGADGADGAPGSVWREGSGAPADTLGINGDFYLDGDTGNVYLKTAGAYSVVANIKGPQGDPGADGADGAPAAVPSSFVAATSVNQTIAVSTDAQLVLDNEISDAGGFFDPTTNYRWTPPAGPVIISARALATAFDPAQNFTLRLMKNGFVITGTGNNVAAQQIASALGVFQGASLTFIDHANGTDWYALLVSNASASTALELTRGSNNTNFTGVSLGG